MIGELPRFVISRNSIETSTVTSSGMPSASGAVPLIGSTRSSRSNRSMRAVAVPRSARHDGERSHTRSSPSRPVVQSVGNQMSGGRTGYALSRIEAAQALRMPRRERLPDERAVAVAVEIDLVDLQRIEHGGDVVDGEMRAVEVRLRAELIGAGLEPRGIARIARLDLAGNRWRRRCRCRACR